jgi:Ca2+-binding EF-hand superfamily protein
MNRYGDRTHLKSILFFGALAVAATGAHAQPGRGSFLQFHPLLAALDANHDNTIDEAELTKAPAALRALDKNQDGRIAAEEMSPMMGRGRGGRGREEEGPQGSNAVEEAIKTYLSFDRNNDGKLVRDEVPERMQGIFDRADADKDGVLTADELRAMARAQQAASGGGREEGPGRGGRDGRGGAGMRDPIFAALDTDHDNAISVEEIANAPAALKALDRNQDGKLTEDELRPNFGPGRGRG